VQQAVRDHCARMRDRIALLDVPSARPPVGADSAQSHRDQVVEQSGFAALYYPWLLVPEPVEPGAPRPLVPLPLAIPPSGHVAGVFARVDDEAGVHVAPANAAVRGVMGLERVLSDREQALINLKGVNALRIFPGDARVMVWGARTTAPETATDWTFVNVRRLLLYIEESIQEGLRWAVFKPNDRPLWKSLTRTLDEFLDRVWRAGGLAGKTRDEAFRVRIDEGLNPPSELALGRLHIEIQVAPVRPAEFIIVRIGLWDGGADATESR
jgi:phage tail sheath protein FI